MSTKQADPKYMEPKGWIFEDPAVAANNAQYFAHLWPRFTANNLVNSFGVGAGVAGLGHLLSKLTSSKPKKKHQGTAGSPVEANDVKIAADGPSPFADTSALNWSTWGAANVVGVPAAGIAGAYLMNKLVKSRKKQQEQARIDAAREEYERALGVKTAELDALYGGAVTPDQQIKQSWSPFNIPMDVLRGYGLYAGTTALGAGGVAAKLMYDMQRQRSNATVLQKAREAKARLSSLPPMWVTPDDIISLRDKKKQAPQMADAA
jgi:hypothetical protein